ncbi:MAG: SirB2 family protein [Pseudomonadota bacterium]|nr:SirB2 family protein [Pseudomonadota bacterium]
MEYAAIRLVHQGAVALSISGFVARGIGAFAGAAWSRGRTARWLPQLVDSVLLLSALSLAWMLGVTPWSAPWLAAKLIALPVYVVLGVLALRPMLPLPARIAAWLAALATVGYIVSVAISKNPAGFLAWL